MPLPPSKAGVRVQASAPADRTKTRSASPDPATAPQVPPARSVADLKSAAQRYVRDKQSRG